MIVFVFYNKNIIPLGFDVRDWSEIDVVLSKGLVPHEKRSLQNIEWKDLEGFSWNLIRCRGNSWKLILRIILLQITWIGNSFISNWNARVTRRQLFKEIILHTRMQLNKIEIGIWFKLIGECILCTEIEKKVSSKFPTFPVIYPIFCQRNNFEHNNKNLLNRSNCSQVSFLYAAIIIVSKYNVR